MSKPTVHKRRDCSKCGLPVENMTSSRCHACNNAASRAKRLAAGVRPRHTASTPEHFWRSVDRREVDSCWEWTAGRLPSGYGQFWIRQLRRNVGAHVYSWELHSGTSVPPGMQVLHSCDNPPCVNPEHLRLGTQSENMTDKVKRRRQCRGERHWSAVLTEETAREIRTLHTQGLGAAAIARRLGLGRYAVWHCLRGHTWKHVS